jgi:hypothetical protein
VVFVGDDPISVAINSITNKIFVVSAGSSELVIIDGATDKAVSGAAVGFFSTAVVVNPVTNKIYVTNSDTAQTVTVIDGVSYNATTVASGNDPDAMVVNPINNKIYVESGNDLAVLTEQQVQPIPLLTKITPLPANQTTSRTPSFSFQTISTYQPVTPPPLAVYFQVDTWQGPWTKASGSNPAFSGQTGTLLLGTHVLYAYASDGQDAGMNANALNGQVVIGEIAAYPFTVMQVSSATVLTADVNPSVPGGTVTLTATVTAIPPGTGMPTGTVTFLDGTTPLGSGAPNSSGVATFATSSLTSGTHSLTAQYAGDTNFVASTSPVLSQVVQTVQSTTITVLSPVSAANYGTPVTFTASVTSGSSATPTGTVTFLDGATTLGIGTLNASGMASFTISILTVGTHSITAAYGGDSNFKASTSAAVTETTTPVTTTTALVSSAVSVSSGTPVTFTATITSSTSGTPTGTVAVLDGATTLGSGTLNSSGVATFTTSSLTVGTHSITCKYAGNAYFAGSTSVPVTETITPAPAAATTAVLVTSAASASSGAPVTLTATITSSTSGRPTGTVTFLDGTTALGTGNLNNTAVATITTSTLAVGTHSITCKYAGNANFAGSTSAAITETITPGATSAALVSSAVSASSGAPVTLTATVTSSSSGTPTGTVTFLDGTTTLGTGTLNNTAVATITTSTLTVGTHSITCKYAGNANFAGSTSAAMTETITPGATTAALVSSAVSASSGAAVTFTATVTSSSPGTPTGTVAFLDGTTTLGTGPLNSSAVATFTTSSLTVGTHSLAASYGGDSNFAASTSTLLSQVVLAPSFTMAGSPASVTVSAGNSAIYQIVVTGKNNFSGSVTLSCSAGLPSGASCASPSTAIAPGSTPANSTLTINTTARTTARLLPFSSSRRAPLFAAWLLVPAILLGLLGRAVPKRRLRLGYALAFLLVGCVLWQAGCASAESTPRVPTTLGTPAGAYAVTVTGTSGAAQQTVSVTLVVQ